MRPSRGMGAVAPSKMPKAKKIVRKDNPNVVSEYAKGGRVKKFAAGGKAVDPDIAAAQQAETKLRNYTTDLMFMDRADIPPPEVQRAQQTELYKAMVNAAKKGYRPTTLPGDTYGVPTPTQWKGVEQARAKGGMIKPRRKKK